MNTTPEQQVPALPPEYSFEYVVNEYDEEKKKNKILMRYQGKNFLNHNLAEGAPESSTTDPAHATTLCWQDYYQRLTDAVNEHAFASKLIWGYVVEDKHYHPGCLTHDVGPISDLEPLLMCEELRNYLCRNCDSPILEMEEVDEFLGPSFDNPEEDERINAYAMEHSSNRIEGFRAGLSRYAEKRGMTLADYVVWLQILPQYQHEWMDGYQDGLDAPDAD